MSSDLPFGNAVIGQSGGPTAVINQSLVGCIERLVPDEHVHSVLGAHHGVSGIVKEQFIELQNVPQDRLDRVAETPVASLMRLGLPRRRARALTAVARKIAHGELRLEPGGDVASALRGLKAIDGVGERLATSIVMRALGWPDAFPLPDRALQRASGASTPGQLRERAESWRPWRAYAAVHLWLEDEARP